MSDHVALVQGIYSAFARGDVPAVLAALDPHIEWREAEGYPYAAGNPYVGPDGVLHGVFMRLGGEWDNFTVTPHEFLATADGAVVLGRYQGTFKSTRRAIDAQFAHVFRLSNGKVTHFQQFTDTAQFSGAMS
jgi:ketosteroid isomerase-like protein